MSILGRGAVDGNRANQSGHPIPIQLTNAVRVSGPVSDVAVRIDILNARGDALYIRGKDGTNRAKRIRYQGGLIDTCDEGILFEYSDHVKVLDFDIKDIQEQDGIEPAAFSSDWEILGGTVDGVPGSVVDVFGHAERGTIGHIYGSRYGSNGAYGLSCQNGVRYVDIDDVFLDGASSPGSAAGIGISLTGSPPSHIRIRRPKVYASHDVGIMVATGLVHVDIEDAWVWEAKRDGILHLGTRSRILGCQCWNNNQARLVNLAGIRSVNTVPPSDGSKMAIMLDLT